MPTQSIIPPSVTNQIVLSHFGPNIFLEQCFLRRQTFNRIDSYYCVCKFLDSRDNCLNMLKFCLNDQKEWNNKRRTKEASFLRNPATMHKIHSLASYCWSQRKKVNLRLTVHPMQQLNIMFCYFNRTLFSSSSKRKSSFSKDFENIGCDTDFKFWNWKLKMS